VADIFRCPEVQPLAASAPARQRKVMRALTTCRTAALGGHVDACDRCGHRQISYNSCRNRHCPKCQGSVAAEWVAAQEQHLLPVPYAHVVFTIPHALHPILLPNRRTAYDLLFRCVSEAMLELAHDPRHLGARIGFLTVLHTWGQTLQFHPHLHCLVPAGGIAPDGSRWIPCRGRFFLPVRLLSSLFRDKYLAALRHARRAATLQLPEPLAETDFDILLSSLQQRDWVVHARPPFGGSAHVLKYLARYTHRVAISNRRLRMLEHGRVTFEYKDYANGHQLRLMTLDVAEFARRFLLHVLPDRFVRIRSYGFLANTCRERQLSTARALLGAVSNSRAEPPAPDTAAQLAHTTTGTIRYCPVCQEGQLRCSDIIAPDTS
jgi:hypothetical protein